MNEQISFIDVVDRMSEHVAVVDHLTNTAGPSIGAVLYMLEREMRSSLAMLTYLVESGIEEEIEEEKKLSLKEKILAASKK